MATRPLRKVLITGGAGFIGCNLAERLLADPQVRLRIFDNLSRSGVTHNLAYLRTLGESRLEFVHGDVRNAAATFKAAKDVDEIYHLAAQVAVTSSTDDPRHDFETNIVGTFNLLEAARRSGRNPFFLFTSTNKVYGSLKGVPVHLDGTLYRADDPAFNGVTEREPLDFHSPYGCSKGAADQYVHDYSRIYGLPTVVFRMSCIAGPHQFGTEDQGWVAHFLYSVLQRRAVTIYGDGFQVRDILHVHDLVRAIEAANDQREQTAGQIYNLGGGPQRAVSIANMLREIGRLTGIEPALQYAETRPGDQPLYIANTNKLTEHTGWTPRHTWQQTLESIYQFWKNHRDSIDDHRAPIAMPAFVAQEVA